MLHERGHAQNKPLISSYGTAPSVSALKCAGGAGFRGDAAEQAHGCAVRAGAVAHALDSELGEFGDRRDTRASQNIYRGLPMIAIGWQRIEQAEDWRADNR